MNLPPLTLYPELSFSLSNFPPACSTVRTVSNADTPVVGCISVGIPRPSSETVHDPAHKGRRIEFILKMRKEKRKPHIINISE